MLRTLASAILRLAVATVLLLCLGIGALALFNGRGGADADPLPGAGTEVPAFAPGQPLELRVVTFNIQDLPVVARDHAARMRAIAGALSDLDPDLVGFQEAFVPRHRALLQECLTSSRLRYFRYYPSATVGSGLLVASAHPITGVRFLRFSRSNPWWKLWEGDWWAGKGAALARIALPGGTQIDFYNTHAQADYGNPRYAAIRLSQMRELASFIDGTRRGTVPALLVGDLNSRPADEEFRALIDLAGLERAMTIDSGIDHILLARSAAYRLTVLETRPITARIAVGGRQTGLSDHAGYFSRIRISPAAPASG